MIKQEDEIPNKFATILSKTRRKGSKTTTEAEARRNSSKNRIFGEGGTAIVAGDSESKYKQHENRSPASLESMMARWVALHRRVRH